MNGVGKETHAENMASQLNPFLHEEGTSRQGTRVLLSDMVSLCLLKSFERRKARMKVHHGQSSEREDLFFPKVGSTITPYIRYTVELYGVQNT